MISVKGLSFRYPGGEEVLKDVSIGAEKGGCLGIVGPNGSGKTTLLKCLSRAVDTPPGAVFLDGVDVAHIPRREIARKIAVVPQDSSFGFDFTAQEVVAMGRYPHLGRFEFESPRSAEIVRMAMDRTKTWLLRDHPVNQLSGGERQRVIIARALAQEPKVLLLDEPTKDLDIRHSLDILNLIERMNKQQNITVIGVFHDLNLCARYCKKVAILKDGRVLAQGETRHVLTSANIRKAFGVRTEVINTGGKMRVDVL
jgi:iron complex transport system ATP-binding protein